MSEVRQTGEATSRKRRLALAKLIESNMPAKPAEPDDVTVVPDSVLTQAIKTLRE